MKLRTVRYIIGEGAAGIYRNKLMTMASIGIVTASMFILGMFFLLTSNLNTNAQELAKQPQIEAFLFPNSSSEYVDEVKRKITDIQGVGEYKYINKEDAMKRAMDMLGERKSVLEGLEGENPLPDSFIISLSDPTMGENVVNTLYSMQDSTGNKYFEEVQYSRDTVQKILKLIGIVKIVSTSLVGLLALIAVFIISNTIKLTVFARRKEINIMKFIGATDGFIRWPFLIEGVFIGLIGSAVSLAIIYFGYGYAIDLVPTDIGIIKVLTFGDVAGSIFFIYLLMGTVLGGVGSMFAIRKHLNV